METPQEKRNTLTIQEIEQLTDEEFDRLPESTKKAFYHYMTLENLLTSDEYYIVRIEGGSVNFYKRES
ncbi:MAG: hypothetical protein KME49_22550 [Brasilonema octagenarum HA4186-MV1]|jgi:hypothetical protein|nr:hypothetical protein [Brasilonema octagenarum HA4186-MV1]